MQPSVTSSRRTVAAIAILVIAGILIAIAGGAAAGGAVAYAVLRNQPAAAAGSVLPGAPDRAAIPSAVAPGSAQEGLPEGSVSGSVASVAPSVVTVVNHMQASSGPFGLGSQSREASGSGVVISAGGDIVTNAHVVEDADRLEVILSDGTTLPATLIGSDTYSDLAVLKIESGKAPAAVLGNSDALLPGDTVIAIGSPLGDLTNTVTVGVVSARDRSLETSSGFQMEGMLQTDAAINSGNSGGPLVSLQGEVVGINTLVVRGTGASNASAEGLGFAIPSNTVRAIANQLMATGQVRRPYLGIRWEWITPEIASANNLSVSYGAYVAAVSQGSPADDAGLREGDVIVGMDGTRFDEDQPFLNALLAHAPGDKVTLAVMRDGAEIQVDVTLSERATT